MKRHESFNELEEAIKIGEYRKRQHNKKKAKVNKEDWQCGDCVTVYSYKVQSCTSPELDRWAHRKFQEGYEYGVSVAEKEVGRLKDAIQTVEDFVFEVVFSRR